MIMEFKIDTSQTYMHITPVTNRLDAKLTAELRQKCRELTENGSQNYIIDMVNCIEADEQAFAGLAEMHEDMYTNDQSLVFTGINEEVMQQLKAVEADAALNIAPTMAEAVDIISMEILERDLFNEE